MKIGSLLLFTLLSSLLLATGTLRADPQLSSWFTADGTRYARIYETTAAALSGSSNTTWSNGSENQTLPAYCGVQSVSYSGSWVYVRSTGLASYIMGPW